MSVLRRDEIAARLEALPGWQHRADMLEKRFDCGDFDGSIRFVNAIAALANAQDHHPDIALSWNDVTLALTSHDVRGITLRDFRLAAAIDELVRAKPSS